MKEFHNPRKYPGFDRLWRKSSSAETDKNNDVDRLEYTHVTFGHVAYVSVISVFMTHRGDLHMVYYIPIDDHTLDLFHRLSQEAGSGAARLAPWPEKKYPEE